MAQEALAFIPTRSSMLNKKAEEGFQAVTYISYKPKNKHQAKTVIEQAEREPETFNIKQAKHEIVKFGMGGLDPQEKEEAKVQLAIKLGAKPRKSKPKNYKQLLEEKKREKQAEQSRLVLQQMGKNQIGKSTAKGKSFDRKRRKQKSDLLDAYGKVKAHGRNQAKKE